MAIWRDPLDGLIADLERVAPAASEMVFEIPPPMEDYSIVVQRVLSRDPAERLGLAADPAFQRVMAFHERLARIPARARPSPDAGDSGTCARPQLRTAEAA